jgi:hypothetical protein
LNKKIGSTGNVGDIQSFFQTSKTFKVIKLCVFFMHLKDLNGLKCLKIYILIVVTFHTKTIRTKKIELVCPIKKNRHRLDLMVYQKELTSF